MIARLLVLTVTFASASAYLLHASQAEPVVARAGLSGLPLQIGEWQGRDAALDDRVVRMLGVDDLTNRTYSRATDAVGLYIGFYQSQREGSAIHSPMNCLPGSGWNPLSRTRINIPVRGTEMAEPRNIEVNRITIAKGLDRQVVLYWYQSHGRIVASEYWGKIYTVWDTLKIHRTDAALVRVVSPVTGTGPEAEAAAVAAATDLVQSMFPLLPKYLPL